MKKFLGAVFAVMLCFVGLAFSGCAPNYDNITLRPSAEKIEMAVGQVQKLNFEMENAPDGMSANLQLNNINNLFTIESEEVEGNKVFYEIKGLKPGKTILSVMSYEGSKTTTLEVEVFDRVTSFVAKDNLVVVAQDGNRYTLANQSYFNYFPVNCKVPALLYTYEGQQVADIVVQKDTASNVNYVKFLRPNGDILTDQYGNHIRFAQGEVILTAEALDYTTGQVMTDVPRQEVKLAIVPEIEIGNLNLIRKGGLVADAIKYYDEGNQYIVGKDEVITVIKNRISDSYLVFEVECATPDVKMEIESTIFECTEIAANNTDELETYTPKKLYSKFFSIQAKDVGAEEIKIKFKYNSAVVQAADGYEEEIGLKLVAITAPYQVVANNVTEHTEAITVYDNAISPYEINVSVLDKVSSFRGVRVALATKNNLGEYVEKEEYYQKLGLTYSTATTRTESFEIPYTDFSNNQSILPIKISALPRGEEPLFSDTIYVILTVVPVEIEGAAELTMDVMTTVPFVIKEGVKSFGLSDQFMVQVGESTLPRTIYLDVDGGVKNFDGFVISNYDTATLSNFRFEFESGQDVVEIKQIVDGFGVLSKQLEFTPKNLGVAKVRVIAQEGYFVDLTIEVVKTLKSATLAVLQTDEITGTTSDEKGNITAVQVAFSGETKLKFSLVKAEKQSTLYRLATEIDLTEIADIDKVDGDNITLEIKKTAEAGENAVLTLKVLLEKVDENFAIVPDDAEGAEMEFTVSIYVYSPVKTIEFVQKSSIGTEQEIVNAVTGVSVYRKSDVGFKYDALSKAECDLRVTLANGTVVDDVINTYDKVGAFSIMTSYGPLTQGTNGFIINQFGELAINNDTFYFDCNNQSALVGTFVFMVTITDHNVQYSSALNVKVNEFTPLEYIGITNYQESVYLSGTNDSFTFYTYMSPEADIQAFDAVFVPSQESFTNLVNVSVSGDYSSVTIQHNGLVASGSGDLYFVPRTLFQADDVFPTERVQKVSIVYSDGSDWRYPELISTAEDFMSAITDVRSAAKHYVIVGAIDLNGYTFENVKPLTGSISGAGPNAKITNVNLKLNDRNFAKFGTNVGLFPSIEKDAQINDLAIEGTIDVNLSSLGTNRTLNLGLLTGENKGTLSNVGVRVTKASIDIKDNQTSNKIFVGGVMGQNSGTVIAGVDTRGGRDPVIFAYDNTQTNLTTVLIPSSFVANLTSGSTDNALGGIAGKNLGRIVRNEITFAIFNNNIYSANVNILAVGFKTLGGIVGQNGTTDARTASLENLAVGGQVVGKAMNGGAGQNVGGFIGTNFASIEKCQMYANVSGQDFVGGLVGFESYAAGVKNNVVHASRGAVIQPLLTALSMLGNMGAFSGNEVSGGFSVGTQNTYIDNGNDAVAYYTLDVATKQVPMHYNYLNGAYQNASAGAFREELYNTISMIGFAEEEGTQEFDSVSGYDGKYFANMFLYTAKDAKEQKLIDFKNKGRVFPFVFANGGTMNVVSLAPDVVSVDAYGKVNVYKEGLAPILVSSILDASKTLKVFINVTNAFDDMRVENMSGEEILSNSYINVYSGMPVSIKFTFVARDVVATGDMGEKINVALVEAEAPDAEVEYEQAYTYYTRAEKYGRLVIFTSTNQGVGQTQANTVYLKPVFELRCNVDGAEVVAQISNFTKLNPAFDSVQATVLARLGTQSIETSFDEVAIEPVDEIEVFVTQISDSETDYLNVTSTKISDPVGGPQYYFSTIEQERVSSTFDDETKCFTIVHRFVLKYSQWMMSENYDGIYYITFSSNNGKEKTVTVNLERQSVVSMTLKNYYDIAGSYSPTLSQTNQVSSGDYNLLEVNVYPYFADFDYIKIYNHAENYDKNNVLLMELMTADADGNLSLLSGAMYDSDGITVTKEVLEGCRLEGGEVARVFVRYTTISKATVDTIARLMVSAVKEVDGQKQTVFENMVALNIVVKDSVFFTIDRREEASLYYLAKGLEYDLSLNMFGFTEDQIKIEVTHEGESSDAVQIRKQGDKYKLYVDRNVLYPLTSQETQGFEVIVTTYGESVVDGIKYQSGKTDMKLVIVDFVVLEDNLGAWAFGSDIDEFTQSTVITGTTGAVVNMPIGSNINFAARFVLGETIEYDAENHVTADKVLAFEKELTEKAAWRITATNVNDGALGAFVESVQILPNTNVASGFMKLDGLNFTPLRVNDYQNPKYYFSYDANYYYEYGVPTFGVNANSFSLATDFVVDAYPNSSQENAIPVNTYSEFLAMEEGGHYIQLSDITLATDFAPIQTQIASFDGNGFKIILPDALRFSGEYMGVFASISEDAVVKNVTIQVPSSTNVAITLEGAAATFGTLAGENSGVVTNCKVVGKSSYSQIAVSIVNQTGDYLGNYVAGLVGVNNGFITSSSVSLNMTAAANVAGFVAVNNNKIAASFVKNTMIVNKSAFSASHKTAGFVLTNGSSASSTAQIVTSYVAGTVSQASIYSVSTEKAINSMPSVSGFVYTNFNVVQDCYSDILINTSSTCAGFVYENSGKVTRSYTTSTFRDPGQEAYVFVRSNKVDTGALGQYEDCFYLVGEVNKETSKPLLKGLTALDDDEFANQAHFGNFAISSNLNKLEGVWFYPARDVETVFKDVNGNMKFTYGRPELVSANVIAQGQKLLDAANTKLDEETGETKYAYYDVGPAQGTVNNPIVIYDAQGFENSILDGASQDINAKHYRIASDIDYVNDAVYNSKTYGVTFTGILEGNGMEIEGFAIDTRERATNAGLFAQIGAGNANNGIVKNLVLAPKYLNMPNANAVGTLCGRLEGGRLFNITVSGQTGQSEGTKILGQNAVGGVVGFATNSFKMQNITSSVSSNASYSHKKANKTFRLYGSGADLSAVSYAGGIVGITHTGGSIVNAKVEGKIFAIAEVCGLMFGTIGANVELVNSYQVVESGQFIVPSVYGGVVAGQISGSVSGVNVTGETDADFIQKSSISSSPAVGAGGFSGLMMGGAISTSNFAVDLVWNKVAPLTVGGIVGEMTGGTIHNTYFAGEQIQINASNNVYDVVEVSIGGLVGKISPELGIATDGVVRVSDVSMSFVEASGKISVNLVNVLEAYVGGIVGQVQQCYDERDSVIESVQGENVQYATLPHADIAFSRAVSKAQVSYKNIIYGGVLNNYVGGLIGAVYSDTSKLYAGEVVMQDAATENGLIGTYASFSETKTSVLIVDNKSTAQITTYYGGITGFGKTVASHTKVLGKYNNKTKPWGLLLAQSQAAATFTSPEFLGKWKDAEKLEWADFAKTEWMNINISSPISGNLTSVLNENRLK